MPRRGRNFSAPIPTIVNTPSDAGIVVVSSLIVPPDFDCNTASDAASKLIAISGRYGVAITMNWYGTNEVPTVNYEPMIRYSAQTGERIAIVLVGEPEAIQRHHEAITEEVRLALLRTQDSQLTLW